MANPCDYGMCNVDLCTDPDCTAPLYMEDTMDTNTITLTLMGTKLMATLNINGSIFGQVYPTREVALQKYFSEAATLEERGVLAEDSSIVE